MAFDGPTLPFRTAREWYELGHSRRSANDLAGAREAFEHAVSGTFGDLPPRSQAGALKGLGEIADIEEDFPAAIRHYRAALALDAKVGVKKRLDALERAAANPEARRRFGVTRV